MRSSVSRGRLLSARTTILAALAAVAATVAFGAVASSANAAWTSLSGTYQLDAGAASPTSTTPPSGGSWFQFENPSPPGGILANATPNNTNPDYTLLYPGNTGLTLGSFQTTASDIVDPQDFQSAPFDIFTDSSYGTPDLQYDTTGGTSGARPVRGDLTAWSVRWGTPPATLDYNQGADSSGSGRGQDLVGTYDDINDVVTINWSSRIYNAFGPPGFNDGTGHWHLVLQP
jgi:hypothetical protein